MPIAFICPHGVDVRGCECRKKSGIYQIVSRDGGLYIGSATHLDPRMRRHYFDLLHGNHHSSRLQNSFRKYGSDHFRFEIVEFVPVEGLIVREQHYLDWLYSNPGIVRYNMSPTAGSWAGNKHSEETKGKLSEKKRLWAAENPDQIRRMGELGRAAKAGRPSVLIGKKTGPRDPSVGAKISAALKGKVGPMLGRKFSDDHKRKISEATKGRTVSNYAKERCSSPESRDKRALSLSKGKVYTIISPDGDEYRDVVNLSEFAKEHGLNKRVLTTKIKEGRQYRGWRGAINETE